MSCKDWNSEASSLGPLQIDYLYFYECQCHGFKMIGAWILIIWVIYLINIVSTTASNYFSPTLSSICQRLKIRYDIAGVTFLAFGNGAPDVFSSITSFSGSVDVSIGIGALLGGSMFVASVVVGAIALISPADVTPKYFVRDILFHMLAVSTLGMVGIIGSVSILWSLLLFLLYAIYVAIVLTSSGSDSSRSAAGNKPETVISSIQTAFWHRSPTHKKKYRKLRQMAAEDSDYPLYSPPTIDGQAAGSAVKYQFLTLNEDPPNGHSADSSSSNQSHYDREITINLFNEMNASEFEGSIVEDYVSSRSINQQYQVPSCQPLTNQYVSFEIEPELGLSSSSTLTTQLLPIAADEALDTSASSSTNVSPGRLRKEISASITTNILATFYWQQESMRHRLRRNMLQSLEAWNDIPLTKRIWLLLESPLILLRDFTIPTLDAGNWNKCYAVAQPIASALFLCYLFGYSSTIVENSTMPTPLLWTLIALPISILVYLLTHHNKPPQDLVLSGLWNLFAFVMSIAWIYTLSKELVVCLGSMGTAFQVSPGFLGLTVLAWGNSIGDLISNTAIARQGFGEMALAGCYGGPVFNILIGLGLSFAYASWRSYPDAYPVQLQTSSILSIAFLYTCLASTLFIVYWKGFKLDRFLGTYLLALYVAYTVCQIILLPFTRSKS
jgi:solute carrier family 24 (sodium/potassium/calcium exchanger), member 6